MKALLKENEIKILIDEIKRSTWQGVSLKLRYEDILVEKPFTWLTKWKDCPVERVNEIQSIHLQTILTLTFTKHHTTSSTTSTTWRRICKSGNERVKHLLNTCEYFLWVKHLLSTCEYFLRVKHLLSTCEYFLRVKQLLSTCEYFLRVKHLLSTCEYFLREKHFLSTCEYFLRAKAFAQYM